jgi:hypothetical protein
MLFSKPTLKVQWRQSSYVAGLDWDTQVSPAQETGGKHTLWGKASERMSRKPFANMSAVIVGFHDGYLYDVRHIVAGLDFKVTARLRNVENLVALADAELGFSVVIVDIDAFDDIETAVDSLVEFRRKAPSSVVVLVSSKVGGDDFGSERLPICDVTLRAPLSAERLKQAVSSGAASRMCAVDRTVA